MNRLIWYDLETTGLNSKTDKIIEIAMLDDEGNKFESYINPECNIPPKITELTGITNENCNNTLSIKYILPQVRKFIEDRPVEQISLIAHNNHNFDEKFLRQAYKEVFNEDIKYQFLDTLKLFRKLQPNLPSYSLKNLATYFKLNIEQEHRALSDIYLLKHIYVKMLNIC
tara:strand:+ start:485 stop:994 length:510 start_codon:yes stop_codon:yes gene_type:complete